MWSICVIKSLWFMEIDLAKILFNFRYITVIRNFAINALLLIIHKTMMVFLVPLPLLKESRMV